MIELLLGHLVGDYLLQPPDMAIGKSHRNMRGLLMCVAHCFIYTACVCAFTGRMEPLIFAFVFMSHYFIDRYSLGLWWRRTILGQTNFSLPKWNNCTEPETFWAPVLYIITDNTIHLVLMWVIFKLL